MPTYVYEIAAPTSGTEPRRFEVFQKMSDAPLTSDPLSGQPVSRVIIGGGGIKVKGLKRSTVVNKKSAAATACGCAPGRSRRGHKHR
jgi:predicted nucleic acid-binding Zn ribbon protein